MSSAAPRRAPDPCPGGFITLDFPTKPQPGWLSSAEHPSHPVPLSHTVMGPAGLRGAVWGQPPPAPLPVLLPPSHLLAPLLRLLLLGLRLLRPIQGVLLVQLQHLHLLLDGLHGRRCSGGLRRAAGRAGAGGVALLPAAPPPGLSARPCPLGAGALPFLGRAASPRSQKVSARDPLSGVGGSGRPRPYLGSCRTAGAVIKSSGRLASRGSRIVLAARPPRARGHPGWRHRDTVSHPAGHPLRVCWHRWGGQGGLGGSDPQPGSLWGSVALLGTCRVGATAPRPPGHAGEAPTQVLVAPNVKPPPIRTQVGAQAIHVTGVTRHPRLTFIRARGRRGKGRAQPAAILGAGA